MIIYFIAQLILLVNTAATTKGSPPLTMLIPETISVDLNSWNKQIYFKKGYVDYIKTTETSEEGLGCKFIFPDLSIESESEMKTTTTKGSILTGVKPHIFHGIGFSVLVQVTSDCVILTKIQENTSISQKTTIGDLVDEQSPLFRFDRLLLETPNPSPYVQSNLWFVTVNNSKNRLFRVSCCLESLICKKRFEKETIGNVESFLPTQQGVYLKARGTRILTLMYYGNIKKNIFVTLGNQLFAISRFQGFWYGLTKQGLVKLESIKKTVEDGIVESLEIKELLVEKTTFHKIHTTSNFIIVSHKHE